MQTHTANPSRRILSRASSSIPAARLQRKCACGGTPGPTGECDECRKKREAGLLRRSARMGSNLDPSSTGVPELVHEVLRSPGRPLDPAARAFMEPHFGHDFSHVRIHTDARASRSAEKVQAQAYTVGHDVVFGAGHYQPASHPGRQLIAHELTHVIQQDGHSPAHDNLQVGPPDDAFEKEADANASALDPSATNAGRPATSISSPASFTHAASTSLQRACLSAAECATPNTTLENFVADTESKPENISKADKRKKDCTHVPRKAACTSDGHGAVATALTSVLKTNYPSRAGFVTGFFVNKDMPADWGAVTQDCSSFMPPLPGGKCTFVPDVLEAEAKQFNAGKATVGKQPRAQWLTATIGTLTHETEHARFDAAPAIPQPNATACKFSDHESNLSEMAAHLSEMHVFYRSALAKSDKDRFKDFNAKFDYWVKNGSEDISGIVKELRCKCECADADYFIKKTVDSVSNSQKWDVNERFMIHSQLQQPKWALKWPVAPPAITPADLPSAKPVPLKFE